MVEHIVIIFSEKSSEKVFDFEGFEKDNVLYFRDIDYHSLMRNKLPENIRNDPKIKYAIFSDIHENKYDLLMTTFYPYYSTYFYVGDIKKGMHKYFDSLSDEDYERRDESGDTASMTNIFLFLSKENKNYILELFDIMICMMKAGYHKLENNCKIDDWIVSCQDPIMFRFIEIMRFKSYLPASEMTWCEIFCTNRQFRQSLVNTMITIFNKLMIDNFDMKYKDMANQEYFYENRKEIRKMIKNYKE